MARAIQHVHCSVYLPLLAVLCMAGTAEAQAPAHAGQYEQADIEQGAQLYSGHCVVCHGERGDAMPGANLGSGKFRHAETDRDLTNVIRNGVAGTAMAPSAYTESELAALVAYLRNMSSVTLSDDNARRSRARACAVRRQGQLRQLPSRRRRRVHARRRT